MQSQKLKTRIGLTATTFTIIGYVLGISVFVLPAEIGAKTGPAVSVTYLIAAVPAFFSCFVAAQAGNLFPISGAGYVGAATILSPVWGFIIVWNIIICMVVGIPFVAYGFAEYWAYFFPSHPRMVVALAVVLIFGLVNLVGVRFTTGFQASMIVAYIAVLLVFILGGLPSIEPANLRPFAPNGWGPVLVGAVEASFAFGGFMVIVEMGEEIRNPRRTIPLALMISFAVVLILYGLAAFILPGLIPWNELSGTDSPMARAAEQFLPPWFGVFIAGSAILGAATTINAWFLTQTRDIYALARDQVFPEILSHVSRKHGEPDAAIIFSTIAALIGVGFGGAITQYAVLTVVAASFIYVIVSLAMFLAPHRVPDIYARAEFKLGPLGLPFFTIGFLVFSLILEGIVVSQAPEIMMVYGALLLPGFAYYAVRKQLLKRRGVRIEEMLEADLGHMLEKNRQ